MGCLSSKEKYRWGFHLSQLGPGISQGFIFRVYEKENERKIKSYRVPGKSVNGYSSSNLSGHLDTSLRKGREVEEENSSQASDKPLDCDMSTIITTPQVKVEAFSSRNQFDRASQLRRSRKKRRKSDAGNSTINSQVATVSPSRDDSRVSSASLGQQEKMFSTSRAEYSSNYGNLI